MKNVRKKLLDCLFSMRVGSKEERIVVFVMFLKLFIVGIWCLLAVEFGWYVEQRYDWVVVVLKIMGWCSTLAGGWVVCVGMVLWFLGRFGCKSV